MGVRRRTSGSGSIRATARAVGSVVSRSVNRPPGSPPAPARATARQALAQVLDGEAVRRLAGFDCEVSSGKTLFIPYSVTEDAATALLICKAQGLISSKLAAMDGDSESILYATTLPIPEPEN